MDDAWPILDFFPNSFGEPGDKEYIDFLWNAFSSNYENEQYQMSLLPYHMLFMSFVYFSIWQIKLIRPTDFFHASIFQKYEKKVSGVSSPFKFHKISETEVFRYLRIIGCDDEQLKPFSELVVERNSLAHANGNISCGRKIDADRRIFEILKQIRLIQTQMTPTLHQCFKGFLIESAVPVTDREFVDSEDQIREYLVHKYYLSPMDIDACRSFDIESLNGDSAFPAIRTLFGEFLALFPARDEGLA